VFRLREKGIKPVRGGATGDLFCRIVIETPVDLSAQQKELLRKFEGSLAADGKSHNPRQSSWFEGVRQFFGRNGD
jgi:molecular chaperone DnaJ